MVVYFIKLLDPVTPGGFEELDSHLRISKKYNTCIIHTIFGWKEQF